MRTLHDIHVNWVDGGSRKHEIPEYHEWKDGDLIEMLDTVQLIVVTPEFFSTVEDGYPELPQELLSDIYKTAVRINPDTKRKNKVDYCFIMTDKVRVMAVNTEGDNHPNLKSRLTLHNDLYIIEATEYDNVAGYKVEPDEYETADDSSLEAKLLSVGPEDYVGLTRIEREMKIILMDCFFNLSLSKNKAEIYYWFIELFPDLYSPTTYAASTKNQMLEDILSFIRKGWSQTHQDYAANFIKVKENTIYKDEWAALVKQSKKKDLVKK